MQHLQTIHPEAYAECWKLEEQRNNPAKNPVTVQVRRSPRRHSSMAGHQFNEGNLDVKANILTQCGGSCTPCVFHTCLD